MKMNTRLVLVILLLVSVSSLHAQVEKVDTAAFQRIRSAELNSSQIPQIAHYITDVSGSRLTNSPGFTRAGNWAIESMKKWGLKSAGFEAWGEYGRGWDVEEFSISMKQPYTGFVIGYPLPWSANTNGEIRASVFEVLESQLQDSVWLEKHKEDIKGKIIFITNTSQKHEDDFKPFSTRYSDSELVNIKNLYVYTHNEIAFFLNLSKPTSKGKIRLKEFGALAMVNSNGSKRDGTVTVQTLSGYKTSSPVLLPEFVISS